MGDGIYILVTKDGYRVTYSKRYHDMVTIEGKLESEPINDCFKSCKKYDTMDEVMDEARKISNKYYETDDGICLIEAGQNKTFNEIIKH
jgi:hypothetical protein